MKYEILKHLTLQTCSIFLAKVMHMVLTLKVFLLGRIIPILSISGRSLWGCYYPDIRTSLRIWRHYATFIMILGSKSSRVHPSSVPSYLPTMVGKSVHRSHLFVDPQNHRPQIAKLVNKNRINYRFKQFGKPVAKIVLEKLVTQSKKKRLNINYLGSFLWCLHASQPLNLQRYQGFGSPTSTKSQIILVLVNFIHASVSIAMLNYQKVSPIKIPIVVGSIPINHH